MALPFLDPHPLGCPVGLAVPPSEIQRTAALICVKLRDLAFFTVHFVSPSRGEPYLMLNMLTDRRDIRPRVVFFPAWEDARRRRRIDWKRQDTLMRRTHEAGVQAEELDLKELAPEDDGTPFELSLACTAAQMHDHIVDLDTYLGDLVRITVTTLERPAGVDLKVVRIYAPTGESKPRLVLYPGWSGVAETPDTLIDADQRIGLRAEANRGREQPIEIYLSR